MVSVGRLLATNGLDLDQRPQAMSSREARSEASELELSLISLLHGESGGGSTGEFARLLHPMKVAIGEEFLFGSVAGTLACVVSNPFETIKTRCMEHNDGDHFYCNFQASAPGRAQPHRDGLPRRHSSSHAV